MNTIVVIFVLLLLLTVWRRYKNKEMEARYKYKLYALRDELRRELLVNNTMLPDSLFNYLDSQISYNIKNAYSITLFRLVIQYAKSQENEKFESVIKETSELRAQHICFDKYLSRLSEHTFNYIMSQHRQSIFVFVVPTLSLVGLFSWSSSKIKHIVKTMTYAPMSSIPADGYHLSHI